MTRRRPWPRWAPRSSSRRGREAPTSPSNGRGAATGPASPSTPGCSLSPRPCAPPAARADPAMPRVYIETYGCQMNVADSELMFGVLGRAGDERAELPDEADVMLVEN